MCRRNVTVGQKGVQGGGGEEGGGTIRARKGRYSEQPDVIHWRKVRWSGGLGGLREESGRVGRYLELGLLLGAGSS